MAVVLAIAMAIGVLTWLYYPTVPRGIIGWIALICVGLPTWLVLDRVGNLLFSDDRWRHLSRGTRILLGVPALLALVAFGYGLVWVGRLVIERAG